MLWNRYFLHLLFPQFSITLYEAVNFQHQLLPLRGKEPYGCHLTTKHIIIYTHSCCGISSFGSSIESHFDVIAEVSRN